MDHLSELTPAARVQFLDAPPPAPWATCSARASFAAPARADTTIAGGNIINQTWTAAGSPYLVAGDIVVPAGGGSVGAATITVTDHGITDMVKISIPKSVAPGGRLFGRLSVTQP